MNVPVRRMMAGVVLCTLLAGCQLEMSPEVALKS